MLDVIRAETLVHIGLCLGTKTVVATEDVGGVEARVGAEARAGKEIIVGGKETGAGEEEALAEGSITGLITGSITGMTTGSITGMTETEKGTQAKEVTLIQVLQTPIEATALIPRDHIMIATELNLQGFLSIHTIRSCIILFSIVIGKWQLEGGAGQGWVKRVRTN